MLTHQEIFDKVCARLRDGAGQSLDENKNCVYHNFDGNKCAAGIFISDAHYSKDMEGSNCVTDFIWKATNLPDSAKDLMGKLQIIHDDFTFWENNQFNEKGEAMLKKTAEKYSLNYTPPNNN